MAYIGNSPTNIVRGRRAVYEFTATAGQTVFTGVDNNGLSLDLLEANENDVYLNGSRLVLNDDYTVSGDTLTLGSAAALNDILVIVTQDEIANAGSYTKAESDSRYINYDGDIVNGNLQIVGDVTQTGDLDVTGAVTADGLTVDGAVTADGLTVDGTGTLDVVKVASNISPIMGPPPDAVISRSDIDIFGDGSLVQSRLNYEVTGAYGGGGYHVFKSEGNTVLEVSNSGISFYEDTGTTAELFWDASVKSLGIGTSSPPSKLSIAGGTADNYTDGITMSKSGGNLYGIYPSLNNLEFRSVTGNTHIMTMTFGGNVGVGTQSPQAPFHTSATATEAVRVESGSAGTGAKIVLKTSDNPSLDKYIMQSEYWTEIGVHANEGLRIKNSNGDIKFKVAGSDGSITAYGDIKTQETPTTEVNTLKSSSYLLKNSGDLISTGDYNDSNLRNSVFYQVGSPSNKAHSNNGVAFYISTHGMGATHNDATNERAAQMYFGDTRDAGMYARVKQGTAGWHDWIKLQNDFAYKEGPNAYQADYRETWHYGGHWGSSMDATSYTDGIMINETGIYIAQMAQRCTTANAMIGLSVNGDRSSYEVLSDSMWGHDHSGGVGGQWSHSIFAGKLQAGWKISGGPPASYSSGVSYSTRGYDGWIIIQRIA